MLQFIVISIFIPFSQGNTPIDLAEKLNFPHSESLEPQQMTYSNGQSLDVDEFGGLLKSTFIGESWSSTNCNFGMEIVFDNHLFFTTKVSSISIDFPDHFINISF